MVAVYPIRLFVLALAVLGVASEVWAQGPIIVGYYDMANGNGGGSAEQAAPIVAAGYTPVLLDNLDNLAGIAILFVQNPSPNVYNAEYLAARPAIAAAVTAGMVLVIHDRTVSNPAMGARVGDILPGVTNPASILAMKGNATTNNNIEVTDATTLVANGPFGQISSSGPSSLDAGMLSNHGWVNLNNPFFTTRSVKGLLHTGASGTSMSVTFSYAFGLGHVIYSSIPLDMFLKGGGANPPRCTFSNVYAPNVLAYGAGLKGLPQGVPQTTTLTVAASPARYGGTTTLTATLKSGSTGLGCRTVTFSLNGNHVGSALTDSSGTATLPNASLGSIGAGSYAEGARADFATDGLLTASSGTGVLEVAKAPLTVTAADATKIYGAELPEFSARYDGFCWAKRRTCSRES
jgi:hypothetical protein